jgi:hypothetical protein
MILKIFSPKNLGKSIGVFTKIKASFLTDQNLVFYILAGFEPGSNVLQADDHFSHCEDSSMKC